MDAEARRQASYHALSESVSMCLDALELNNKVVATFRDTAQHFSLKADTADQLARGLTERCRELQARVEHLEKELARR